jgi:hypothetical protein
MKKYLAFVFIAFFMTITGIAVAQLLQQQSITMQVAAAHPVADPASLDYLRKHIGDDSWGLFETQPLGRRMRALLGPEYPRFIQNMGVSTPLADDHGVLYICGNAPHNGGTEDAVLLINDRQNRIEVIVLHDGKFVRAWAEGNRAITIPAGPHECLANWSADEAVARALGKLLPDHSR